MNDPAEAGRQAVAAVEEDLKRKTAEEARETAEREKWLTYPIDVRVSE